MAQAMVTDTMREKAERLAEVIPFCDRGRSKHNGQGFYLVPGSQPGVRYYSSDLGCTCPGYRNRGVCTHQQACLIVLQRAESVRIAEAQQRRTLNGPCRSVGCCRTASKPGALCGEHSQVLLDSLGW